MCCLPATPVVCCRVITIHSIVARSYYIVCYACMCTAWDFGSSNHLVGIVMGFKDFPLQHAECLYVCMNHPHVVPVPYLPCTVPIFPGTVHHHLFYFLLLYPRSVPDPSFHVVFPLISLIFLISTLTRTFRLPRYFLTTNYYIRLFPCRVLTGLIVSSDIHWLVAVACPLPALRTLADPIRRYRH